MLRLLLSLVVSLVNASAIDLRIYSEFQRVDGIGNIVPQDRAIAPREVLSPAVVRNSFASFRVVVTGPPNTFYFIAVQTNPIEIFRIRLYREVGFVSSALVEERNPAFSAGVTPYGRSPETANCYLLDIWVPPDARPGPARVEVLVKTVDWKVAPMELRILPVTVPDRPAGIAPEIVRSDLAADLIAFRALLFGPNITTAGSPSAIIARNAAQDAALLGSLGPASRARVREAALAAFTERDWTLFSPRGGESYMPVRQMLFREAVSVASR